MKKIFKNKILLFTSIFFLGLFLYSFSSPNIDMDTLYFEYGEDVAVNKDVLENNFRIKNAKLNIPDHDEECLDVGVYEAELLCNGYFFEESYTIDVVIEDTKAPDISLKEDKIRLLPGGDVELLYNFVEIDDLSESHFIIETDDVDFNHTGIYDATIKAVDIHGNNSEENITFEIIEDPTNYINDCIYYHGGIVEVFYKDLKTGQCYSLNNDYMYPCSAIKMCVLLAAYQAANEGIIDLDACMKYIKPMIVESCNDSYNAMLIKIGQGDGNEGLRYVNNYLSSIGIGGVWLQHSLHPSNYDLFRIGPSNMARPSSLLSIYEMLYNHELFSIEQTEEILKLLKSCADDSAIATGLPLGVEFAHKTGWGEGYYLDAGIVYGENTDYLIAIFTKDTYDYSGLFEKISSYFYELAN